MIKIFLVDDSEIALRILARIIATQPDMQVIGTAKNGKQALTQIKLLRPNVVCTDLHMPEMDGLQLTQEIMQEVPTPVLVVSVAAIEGSMNVFKLLAAGALDVMLKPAFDNDFEKGAHASELIRKIRVLSGVHVFRRQPQKLNLVSTDTPIIKSAPASIESSRYRMVIIGTSTGGPQALFSILPKLPADFSVPIVCVQHISDGFLESMMSWLRDQSHLKFELARHGQTPVGGNVYFPPERRQLKFDHFGRFAIGGSEPYRGHCPSVSITMLSAAEVFGKDTFSILLTGMGDDGVDGMQAIYQRGGMTVAQDQATSVVFGMPKQAIDAGVVKRVLPLEEIAGSLSAIARVAKY